MKLIILFNSEWIDYVYIMENWSRRTRQNQDFGSGKEACFGRFYDLIYSSNDWLVFAKSKDRPFGPLFSNKDSLQLSQFGFVLRSNRPLFFPTLSSDSPNWLVGRTGSNIHQVGGPDPLQSSTLHLYYIINSIVNGQSKIDMQIFKKLTCMWGIYICGGEFTILSPWDETTRTMSHVESPWRIWKPLGGDNTDQSRNTTL